MCVCVGVCVYLPTPLQGYGVTQDQFLSFNMFEFRVFPSP